MAKKTTKKNVEFDYTIIKTFADACKKCGTTEKAFNEKWLGKGFEEDTISYERLKLIYRAVNNDRKPDWKPGSDYKYYPWFWVLPSGLGFDYSFYGCVGTYSIVGSRLCTFSREQVDHIVKYFKEEYVKFHLITE